ncbi:hypothetical protein A2U01_0008572, partial [Trifolium medium]|nr:hypothetical protein [Trifolium medium]
MVRNLFRYAVRYPQRIR